MPPDDRSLPTFSRLPAFSPLPATHVLVGLVVAALPFLDCGVTDLGRDGQARVQTSAQEYTLRETEGGGALEVEIPYRYENRTGAEICLTNCIGVYAVRLLDESGESAWSPVLPACLSAPITIEPGETLRDTLVVSHALEPDRHPRFEGDPAGVFRLDVAAASHPASGESCGEPLPAEERTSNRFRLVRD